MTLFYEAVLSALAAAEVRFVIVGGTAVILHGVPRTTADLDVVADLEGDNVARLVDALLDLGFLPRAPVDPRQLARAEIRDRWIKEKGMKAFSFHRPDRPLDAVDVLLDTPRDYAALMRRAVKLTAGDNGLTINIGAIEDLIAMKRSAGRAQDDADIDALTRLLEATRGE